ncbi:MAG: hypothetical protein LBH69_05415 [Methanomassiliicoccaceae archaeon]|jgi:hypothetical protein|nr:hypothetical protein [Methanomassiliicoccaceae archaeon]
MQIPVMPLRTVNGNIVTSRITISGTSVAMTENTMGYNDLMSSLSDVLGRDVPMLGVDVDGVRKKDLSGELLRKIRSKHELWLMTGIRNAGDVMDAFHGSASRIIVPYHFTSDALLREIIELSDSCIPALFAERDDVYAKGKKKDLRSCIRTLTNMNFRKMIVFDAAGGSVRWDGLHEFTDVLVPYAATVGDAEALHKEEFGDVVVSAADLFRNASKRSEIGSCMLP